MIILGNALGCRNLNFLDNREYYVFLSKGT